MLGVDPPHCSPTRAVVNALLSMADPLRRPQTEAGLAEVVGDGLPEATLFAVSRLIEYGPPSRPLVRALALV